MKPRKNLGQHFLIDSSVLHIIAKAISTYNKPHIVEIGPGLGALTKFLLPAKKLELIELDTDLANKLKKEVPPHVKVHNCDVLKVKWEEIVIKSETQIVGNLPYNIASQIILQILKLDMDLLPCVFLIQQEMADRILAHPCSSNYGRFSVMVQFFANVSYIIDISPCSFDPQPKVDSAVVMIRPFTRAEKMAQGKYDINFDNFSSIVRQSFCNKRKQLHNNIKNLILKDELIYLFNNPKIRAEELSVHDFINLTKFIESKRKLELNT